MLLQFHHIKIDSTSLAAAADAVLRSLRAPNAITLMVSLNLRRAWAAACIAGQAVLR